MSLEYWIIDTDDFVTRDFTIVSTTAIDAAAPFVNLVQCEIRVLILLWDTTKLMTPALNGESMPLYLL